MDDLLLTDGNDVFTNPEGAEHRTIRGLDGDDKVTVYGNGHFEGGPGNDILVNLLAGSRASAAFWRSPGPIQVDLQAGYALDGFGTRDTLTNITGVFTPGRNGDTVFGSGGNDWVMLNGFAWYNDASPGSAFVDLRGGFDEVNFWELNPTDFTIKVSGDGRRVEVGYKNYSATLLNVEVLIFSKKDLQSAPRSLVSDLIDFTRVGPQTLLDTTQKGWSGKLGQASSLNFSFMSAAPGYGGADGGTGFSAPNAAYQAAVRSVLSQLSQQVGLSFTEVPDADSVPLRFGTNQQATTKGYAFVPGVTADARAGDVWLDLETLQLLAPGQEGWQVLLHEIGHALGLQHPLAASTATDATVLLDRWNHNGYTVMSETASPSGIWQSWFGALDLQALKHLYGTRASGSGPGDDVYRYTDAQGQSIAMLMDGGGTDRLDLSALSLGVYADLTPGSFSSMGLTARGTASTSNLFIDSATQIEQVVGTAFDDVLLGNGADNVFWPRSGNDIIEGRGGLDTVIYDGARAGFKVYTLEDGSGNLVVADARGAAGSHTLSGVERVVFADQRLAFDLAGRAGDAARLVATVYGSTYLSDPAVVGPVLTALDAGASLATVYANAVQSSLHLQRAGGGDDLSFMKLMFLNVVNVSAPDAVVQPFVSQFLASGAYSHAGFAQAVSALTPVDLVGLAQTGLAFSG